jgi:glycosyltransferase involved in cell wall biosynthesis
MRPRDDLPIVLIWSVQDQMSHPLKPGEFVSSASELLSPSSGEPLKIMLVAHKFPPFVGGIEIHTYEVGRRMASLGHAVTVVTGDPSETLPSNEMVSGMRVLRLPVYPRSSDIFFAPGIFGLVGRERWDVAHVQGFHTLVPPLAMMALLRCKLPFVMTFHSGGHSASWRNRVRGLQAEVLRPLLMRASHLVAVSQFEAQHFATGLRIPRDRIEIVPNGAEIEPVADVEARPPDAPLILSVGRLERYKGHHRVIEAFDQFRRLVPKAELRVIGEGPFKPQLLEQVKKFGLNGCATVGAIPSSDRRSMARMLSSASLIMLLSEYEAHPVAALEAISLGRKIIATNSTGFAEMVDKGLIRGVDPKVSAAELVNAMVQELSRPNLAVTSQLTCDWDMCAGKLLQIYRRVLAAADQAGDRLDMPLNSPSTAAKRQLMNGVE